jgi:hypothetical protein
MNEKLTQILSVAEAASNAPDGERLAAIAAVERMLAKLGLRLRDLIAPPPPPAEARPWRALVGECLQKAAGLTDWQEASLSNLRTFRDISAKQREVLEDIAASVGVPLTEN